jgi:signal transduction histidine kinase
VQQIVSQYKGSVQLEAVVNQGSTFRLTFPIADSSDNGVI